MDIRPNEQQVLLRDSAARFLREEYSFERRRTHISEASPQDPGMWSKISELGWPGVWLPEERGGLGGSLIELSILMEELGRGLYVGPFLSTSVLGGAILRGLSSEKAQSLLGSVAGGDVRLALAHGEPGGRGFLDAPSAKAASGADTVVLTGRKRLVHNATFADVILVTARGPEGVGLYAITPDQQGVVMRHYRTVDNDWASDISLEQAVAERIGEPVEMAAALDNTFCAAAIALGAEALGLAEAAFKHTQGYVDTRKQFGKALSDFQVIQHRLADMFVEIEQLRATLLYALSRQSSADRCHAAAGLKAQAGTIAASVAGQCLHLHGGMGMTDEMPISHYFRRARILQAQFGNSDYYLAEYAKGMK